MIISNRETLIKGARKAECKREKRDLLCTVYSVWDERELWWRSGREYILRDNRELASASPVISYEVLRGTTAMSSEIIAKSKHTNKLDSGKKHDVKKQCMNSEEGNCIERDSQWLLV